MNEMNNWENNNQNIEQQNLNENQNMVQPEQQYVQPEQPVNNQEPPKKSNALIIILLLLVIGLAGFIVYDKVLKKEEVKEPEKQEKTEEKNNNEPEKQNEENSNQEENSNVANNETEKTNEKIEVTDAYVDIKDYGIYKGKGIKIPKITGSSSTIKDLNNRILINALKTILDYKDFMILQLASEDEVQKSITIDEYAPNFYDCYNSFEYSYKYYKKDDILIIKVIYDLENHVVDPFGGLSCWNASGKSANYYDYYFYDIKNDKSLTFLEAIKRLGAKFDKESECKKYTDIKNESEWGTLEATIDQKGNMTVSCY